jgi:hypothetical protein
MKTINDSAPESTGIPRSVIYFNGDKKFKTKIKRINEIKRTENKPKFSVGDIVRISKQVLDKEVRKQIKKGAPLQVAYHICSHPALFRHHFRATPIKRR